MFGLRKKQDDQSLLTEIKYLQQMVIDLTYDVTQIKQETIKSESLKEMRKVLGNTKDKTEASSARKINKGLRDMITTRAKRYLSTVEYMSTEEIFSLLENEGVKFDVKHPSKYVSLILSTSNMFECDRRQGYGWKLKEQSNL